MDKLLVLGTNSNVTNKQVIEYAKSQGIYTIVTDYFPPEKSEIKRLADEYWMISTNDLLPQKGMDEKKKLRISKLGMLLASVVILVIAYLNPPQIFVIMYFGSSVIAASWGVVSFGSVWSKKLSENGAFWGMLSGFVACGAVRIISAVYPGKWPLILEPFIVGLAASFIGAIIGTKLRPATEAEKQERELLFKIPEGENDPAEMKKTKGCGWIYMIFAVAVFAFFWFMWAVPYLNA